MTTSAAAVGGASSGTLAASSSSGSAAATTTTTTSQFGHIVLDISNSVLPLERLSVTPSSLDGLKEQDEFGLRSLGCDYIQIAGKLLRLPQVS